MRRSPFEAEVASIRPAHTVIDDQLRRLDRLLQGPARLKRDLLTEARHSLLDCAEAYRDLGMPAGEAERRAVAEFGPVPLLSAGYQAELAAGSVRSLALRTLLVRLLLALTTNLMWSGAPWTGTMPPFGYRLLASALDQLSLVGVLLAGACYLWSVWTARRGRTGSVRLARAAGWSLTGLLGLTWLGAIAVYAWSVRLWDAALTWPPMLVGAVVVGAVFAWLCVATRSCLAATGRAEPEAA